MVDMPEGCVDTDSFQQGLVVWGKLRISNSRNYTGSLHLWLSRNNYQSAEAHCDRRYRSDHRQHASQTTTPQPGGEDLLSTSLPTCRALPVPLLPPAAAPCVHPILPVRQQGSLWPPHPSRPRSQLRQGQDVRKRSQGSEAAR